MTGRGGRAPPPPFVSMLISQMEGCKAAPYKPQNYFHIILINFVDNLKGGAILSLVSNENQQR